MPSLHFHGHSFIHKLPFKLLSLSSFTKISNVQTHQTLPIIDRFISFLEEFSENVSWVRSIHAQIIVNSQSKYQFLAAKLVKAYGDLGCLDSARDVFDQIPQPKTILCNALLNGYLHNECYEEAVQLFKLMSSSDLSFDSHTCTFVLKACTRLGDYDTGMEVIRRALDRGIEKDRFVGTSMIKFLTNLGDVVGARQVFSGMTERDVVCWNSMIGGYVKVCQYDEAFNFFLDMLGCGIRPSPVTVVSLTQACGGIRDLDLGRCIHGYVLGSGMGRDISVLTSLVDMYNKIGDYKSARLVFGRMPMKNIISWNAMISCCVQNGYVHEAFNLFHELVTNVGSFDSMTVVSLLHGCAQIADLESGKILHGCILRQGLEGNVILSTAVVDLYSKCGALKEATFVFDRMKDRNVITWTAMIGGLAQNGHAEEALKLFSQMQSEGIAANSVTLVSLVHSCAHLGSLKKGRSVHAQLFLHGSTFEVVNRTALIDMYAKCGKINHAERVFNGGTFSKDVILWNSMITGYGMHGQGHQALVVYSRMIKEGLKPNQTTFISLLSACSHSGLVEEGRILFHSMESDHKVRPTEKHYACYVDLLSRAGLLEEAEALIKQMPFEPSTAVFEALLSGCRTHKNIDMGIRTADRLLRLDTMNPGIYIMLSNIYAHARRWDAVDYIRGLMRKQGLRKIPGYTLIEVGNQVHTFFAGDDSHPNRAEINQVLENLRLEVEALGYVADTSCILRDVDEPMKMKLLWRHSERLAIAFGLLSTPAGSSIRITKNLRICLDCHVVTKHISKMVRREIIVRDANRFHHFINGTCSCNDYW
ncbi:hypothetical protein SLA2020_401390 [Shorea laevis]